MLHPPTEYVSSRQQPDLCKKNRKRKKDNHPKLNVYHPLILQYLQATKLNTDRMGGYRVDLLI